MSGKQVAIRLTPDDLAAIEKIKKAISAEWRMATQSDAIRYALRKVAKELRA